MGQKKGVDQGRLKLILQFLKKYKRIPTHKRHEFSLSDTNVQYLSEIILNFLNLNIHPSSNIVKSLAKFKTLLRNLKKLATSKKRTFFTSVKGLHILNTLLPYALQTINNLLLK